MAVVWVPALLRDLTGGSELLHVSGGTVGELIDAMDRQYPGVKERLLEGDRLRGAIAVVVDGAVSVKRLRQKLDENSEVHFLPAISGG